MHRGIHPEVLYVYNYLCPPTTSGCRDPVEYSLLDLSSRSTKENPSPTDRAAHGDRNAEGHYKKRVRPADRVRAIDASCDEPFLVTWSILRILAHLSLSIQQAPADPGATCPQPEAPVVHAFFRWSTLPGHKLFLLKKKGGWTHSISTRTSAITCCGAGLLASARAMILRCVP